VNPFVDSLDAARHGAIPIRIGSVAEFARVREFLHAVGFDERSVLATLKLSDLGALREADSKSIDRRAISPALLDVIELLVLGETLSVDRLIANCGDAVVHDFAALGLIRNAPPHDGVVVCPVWVYPVDGFYMTSDRQTGLDEKTARDKSEVVFPAHDLGALQMLRLLPATNGGDGLDLCGGSGVGGLHLARDGLRAVTADITRRSTYFAEFNARLNAINVEAVCGDLYEPVPGRNFDVICCHPPWLPSTGDAMIFRDGGDIGEAVVQRVFAGMPDHLRVGGTGIVVALGRDGSDAAYEQRARLWLGERGCDCDMILGISKIIPLEDMIQSMYRLHLKGDAEQAERLAARYREHGTEKFVYGATIVRRTGTNVGEPPLRLRMSAAANIEDFDRVFTFRHFRRGPHFTDWLAAARPRLCPELEATVRFVVRDGAMKPTSAILATNRPLAATVNPEPWIAGLVQRLEGTETVEQTFDAATRVSQMPPDFTLPAFVDLVGQMIERGILNIDLPARQRGGN
jgi:methylase of polypeptide subunit release factors